MTQAPETEPLDLLRPEWPAPSRVRAWSTTRRGGVSRGPHAALNLADHVEDAPAAVAANRLRLVSALGLAAEPCWLTQVHGTRVLDLDLAGGDREADACLTRRADVTCAVLTADCLPVLFCDRGAGVVAAAHAGWRGLSAGVLERTVEALGVAPSEVLAWLGPAIGPDRFEVGPEVRAAFLRQDAGAEEAFRPSPAGRWLADLYTLARRRLAGAGVQAVYGGGLCVHSDAERFYSYRRDRTTGRMATLICLAGG